MVLKSQANRHVSKKPNQTKTNNKNKLNNIPHILINQPTDRKPCWRDSLYTTDLYIPATSKDTTVFLLSWVCLVQSIMSWAGLYFCVARDDLELLIFLFYLLSVEITGVYHQAPFMWGLNPGLKAFWESSSTTELHPGPPKPLQKIGSHSVVLTLTGFPTSVSEGLGLRYELSSSLSKLLFALTPLDLICLKFFF